MLFSTLVLLFVVSVQCELQTFDLPKFFPRCNIDDPSLNDCMLKATDTVRPAVLKGIRELGIPSINPLIIPAIYVQQTTPILSYNIRLSNLTVNGMQSYKFTAFGYHPQNYTLFGTLQFRGLNISTGYELNGTIFAVDIEGEGFMAAQTGPSNGTLEMRGEIVTRDGEEYYHPLECDGVINIDGGTAYFDGLFNNDKDLSRAANRLITQNSDTILREVSPRITRITCDLLLNMMTRLSKHIPFSKIFPPSERLNTV